MKKLKKFAALLLVGVMALALRRWRRWHGYQQG